jgi:hypothetical protein
MLPAAGADRLLVGVGGFIDKGLSSKTPEKAGSTVLILRKEG